MDCMNGCRLSSMLRGTGGRRAVVGNVNATTMHCFAASIGMCFSRISAQRPIRSFCVFSGSGGWWMKRVF
eukprot:99762-Rhodomonas_salina.1